MLFPNNAQSSIMVRWDKKNNAISRLKKDKLISKAQNEMKTYYNYDIDCWQWSFPNMAQQNGHVRKMVVLSLH